MREQENYTDGKKNKKNNCIINIIYLINNITNKLF